MKTSFLFLLGAALAAPLFASDIPILNSDFGAQKLAPGQTTGYPHGVITDWDTSMSPDDHVAYFVYRPTSTNYTLPVPNASGNVAGLLEDAPDVYISQTLTTDLKANDTYTLTYWAGLRKDTGVFNPSLGCYTFNAMIEAGGNVLAKGNPNCDQLTVGAFTKLSYSWTSGANPLGLGDPLEIVLTTGGSGSYYEPAEVDFASVSLTDTTGVAPAAAPEPSSFLLLTSLLPLGLWMRRRKA